MTLPEIVAIFFCEKADKLHKKQQVSNMKDSSFCLAVIDAESTGFFEPRRQEGKEDTQSKTWMPKKEKGNQVIAIL